MSAATSSRSCATWSRFPSRSRARESARTCARARNRRRKSAWSTRWSGRAPARRRAKASARGCAPASSTTRKSRSRCSRRRRHADVRNPRHAGRADGRHQSSATSSASSAAGAPRRGASPCRIRTRSWSTRRSDKLLDNDQLIQESIKAVEKNGIVFLDEIDKIAGREGRMGADVSREGVQRDLLAADRGHHRRHQARPGEDRPHPVHRLRRVPCVQALRPVARAARPAADPRRIERADARRYAPHSDRAGSLA